MDAIEVHRTAEEYRRRVAKHGFSVPLPPFMKRSILRKFAMMHGCETLVETGTQYGDTPWYFRDDLKSIYSIELSSDLAALARDRFRSHPHIHIVEGDSGTKLKEVIGELRSKTLFWLDGHFSSGLTAQGELDCPIFGELSSIFESSPVEWVVLIDDARCFGHDKDYPSLETLKSFAAERIPASEVSVLNDIIILTKTSA